MPASDSPLSSLSYSPPPPSPLDDANVPESKSKPKLITKLKDGQDESGPAPANDPAPATDPAPAIVQPPRWAAVNFPRVPSRPQNAFPSTPHGPAPVFSGTLPIGEVPHITISEVRPNTHLNTAPNTGDTPLNGTGTKPLPQRKKAPQSAQAGPRKRRKRITDVAAPENESFGAYLSQAAKISSQKSIIEKLEQDLAVYISDNKLLLAVKKHVRDIMSTDNDWNKGQFTNNKCMYRKAKGEVSRWPKGQRSAKFACRACVKERVPCLRLIQDCIFVLRLPSELMGSDCRRGEWEYHILRDGSKFNSLLKRRSKQIYGKP